MRVLCLLAIPALAIWLGACSRGDLAVQAIEGATLIDGTPQPPVSPANVIVERGRIELAGPASQTPIPSGAARIAATGLYVFPLDPLEPIRAGADANLLLLNVNPALEPDYLKHVVGRMQIGRWTKYP